MITIWDLDGTLALNEHRQHYLKEKPKNWDAFTVACIDDKPNVPLFRLLEDLMQLGEKVFILSGRSESVKHETMKWLGANTRLFPYYEEWERYLYMRQADDYRDDREVKAEMFFALKDDLRKAGNSLPLSNKNFLIFDDRQKVVDMWREMGLTCCQVAPGNF